MAVAILHPGAIGDLVLALPLAQTLARQAGPVELFAIGDRARFLVGRSAVAAGHCLDSMPLAPLFAADAEARPTISIVLGRFDRVLCCYPSRTLLANLGRVCSGVVEAMDVRPATIAESGLHAGEFIHRQFFDFAAPLPVIHDREGDVCAGRELLASQQGRPTLLIHPGSGGAGKCWPMECFVKVARLMMSSGWHVVFVVGPAERERGMVPPAGLSVLADLTLEQLLWAISAADAFLGNDSGPTHLAAAAGRPTVAIFGSTDPAVWSPRGVRVDAVCGDPSAGWGWSVSPKAVAKRVLDLTAR